jgi:hypothetical protein
MVTKKSIYDMLGPFCHTFSIGGYIPFVCNVLPFFGMLKPLFSSEPLDNLGIFSLKGAFLIRETPKPLFSSEVKPLFFLGECFLFLKH